MYPKDNKKHIHSRANGFTLIELMVVISIIAMLMAMLMPALSKAKEIARQVVCMTNQKGLHLAWEMYAQENNDGLCHPETKGNNNQWVADGLTGAMAGNTFASLKDGSLWPYTETEDLYKCPSDKTGLIRSYSISLTMGYHMNRDNIKSYQTRGSITQPSSRLVFIDAMPWFGQPWLDGPFRPIGFSTLTGGTPSWLFSPTITAIHSNGCNSYMADGHSVKIKWTEPVTLAIARREKTIIDPQDSVDNEDIELIADMVKGTR
jgi:prepilin-type N-terminal cleavage/methylation domain-containing protein/prepilin-type processing-associated H-X9-DG protein